MAVLIPNGFAEITLNWSHLAAPRQWATVFGVDVSEALSPADALATVQNAVQAEMFSRMDISITWVSLVGRFGPNSGSAPGPTIEIPIGTGGALSFEGPPPNTSVLLQKVTALGGRANRGRAFWPGLVSRTDLSESGVISGGPLAAIQADVDSFLAHLATGNGGATAETPMVILHDETSPTTTPTPVIDLVVDSLVATQRRRLRP